MTHVLIITTFLAGSAWGPQQRFITLPTYDDCKRIERVVWEEVNEMAKTNLQGGSMHVNGREKMRTRCEPASVK